MNIQQLLDDHKLSVVKKSPVICFHGEKEYPVLFFSYLWRYANSQIEEPIKRLLVSEHDYATIVAQLETSFLGQQQVYWLGNISELPEKKRTAWLTYVKKYQGPNRIAFFISEAHQFTYDHAQIISLPDHVDKKISMMLVRLFRLKLLSSYKQFIDDLFVMQRRIKLDSLCLLLQYMIRGAQGEQFFSAWVPALINSDISLFTLSQYFFARNHKAFARQWHIVKDMFPQVFWTTFWSEQIWRAYNYRYLSEKKQFAQAKKIGYRLPFSFMQKDWRLYTSAQLRTAHAALYELDYNLKNSVGTVGLDLFLSRFLANDFGDEKNAQAE